MRYQYMKPMRRDQRIKKIRAAHDTGCGNPVTNEEVRWLCDEVNRSWLRGWKKGWKACENRAELMKHLSKIKRKVLS